MWPSCFNVLVLLVSRWPGSGKTTQSNLYHYRRSTAGTRHQPNDFGSYALSRSPMYDPALQHRPFSIQPLSDLESWSAFPSDHAAYLCALAFGLAYLSRSLTVSIFLYAAGWICLPRLYLGVHYASDIVVGTGIGVATVWAVLRVDWFRSFLASRVLAQTGSLAPFQVNFSSSPPSGARLVDSVWCHERLRRAAHVFRRINSR
jgi:membrane-associated phospholipid phosphatase